MLSRPVGRGGVRWGSSEPPFWPQKILNTAQLYISVSALPFVSKWSTSFAAIENHHCPNEFGCSYICTPYVHGGLADELVRTARKRFMQLRWKDTSKYVSKWIAISRRTDFTNCPSGNSPLTMKRHLNWLCESCIATTALPLSQYDLRSNLKATKSSKFPGGVCSQNPLVSHAYMPTYKSDTQLTLVL